jgi:hypothetical protein
MAARDQASIAAHATAKLDPPHALVRRRRGAVDRDLHAL